jgi:1,4-dihydroxy-6-naphthoate synthase
MDSVVMNKHIKLYVNKYSINLGKDGKRAIDKLFGIAGEKGIIPVLPDRIFLTSH